LAIKLKWDTNLIFNGVTIPVRPPNEKGFLTGYRVIHILNRSNYDWMLFLTQMHEFGLELLTLC